MHLICGSAFAWDFAHLGGDRFASHTYTGFTLTKTIKQIYSLFLI